MQAHLPGPGLACGVLHEVAAAAHGDRPAAFGFLFALTAAALRSRPAPPCSSPRGGRSLDFGTPYGHGLAQLGLDVGRLLIVETQHRQGRALGDRGHAALARPGRPWSPARSRATSISPSAAG